jgi:DNA polymerase-3 subunit delta'
MAALDVGLRVTEVWMRDAMCVAVGAGEVVHALDRLEQLSEDAARCGEQAWREGAAAVADTRMRLAVNVSEELALEAGYHRLEASVAGER